MLIAFVVTRSDAVGGAQIHVRDMAVAVVEKGHQAIVMVGGDGVWIDELRSLGVVVRVLSRMGRSIHPIRDIGAYFELRSVLSEVRPDIVSTHTAKAGWLGRIAAHGLGIPVLFTAHGWTFTEGVPKTLAMIWRIAERMVGSLANRVITICEYDRKLAVDKRVIKASRITVVNNGVRDVEPALYGSPRTAPVKLVMVARFESQKDHRTLVLALVRIKSLQWTIHFVGGGPKQAEIEALCSELGIRHRVVFEGAIANVSKVLASSQVFVLSTHWEGLPRSIMEAMRAGLPIIGSDIAGIPELIEDGVNGYVVPAHDVKKLSEALTRLIDDPELRAAMGAKSRTLYEERFRFETMLAGTFSVYESVLGQEAAAARISAPEIPGLMPVAPVVSSSPKQQSI